MNKAIMRKMGFTKAVERVELGKCPFCGKTVKMEEFDDELSKREFKLSGLCQSCQNKTFA